MVHPQLHLFPVHVDESPVIPHIAPRVQFHIEIIQFHCRRQWNDLSILSDSLMDSLPGNYCPGHGMVRSPEEAADEGHKHSYMIENEPDTLLPAA